MAWAQLADRVGMSSATSGTGVLTLGSALGAVPPNTCSWQSFATGGIADGQLVSYLILDSNGAWEYGHGTYASSGTTLTRTTVLGSSNSGSAINCSGAEQIFLTLLKEDLTGRLISVNTYTSTNSSLTIPNYATQAFVRLVGGGGGAKATGACGFLSTGGGAGGYLEKFLTGLTPGNTLSLTIGAGGLNTPAAGGNSSLASGTQSITTLTANGGGLGNNSGGGAGGTCTNGDLNITGGAGSVTASGVTYGTLSGGNPLAAPTPAIESTSLAGQNYGGGAISALSNGGTTPSPTSAAGAQGVCIIAWYS